MVKILIRQLSSFSCVFKFFLFSFYIRDILVIVQYCGWQTGDDPVLIYLGPIRAYSGYPGTNSIGMYIVQDVANIFPKPRKKISCTSSLTFVFTMWMFIVHNVYLISIIFQQILKIVSKMVSLIITHIFNNSSVLKKRRTLKYSSTRIFNTFIGSYYYSVFHSY